MPPAFSLSPRYESDVVYAYPFSATSMVASGVQERYIGRFTFPKNVTLVCEHAAQSFPVRILVDISPSVQSPTVESTGQLYQRGMD